MENQHKALMDSRQKQEVEMRISQGNLLNATHIHLNAGTDKTASTSAEA
ncbi:TPA: hypothetical protein QB605_002150, partial [Pasteurella multocida]|nr:hypothetical protein [Pasteurella multocida]